MPTTFVPKLQASHIIETQKTTHDIWGDGLSLEHRLKALHRQLDFSERNILSMCGLLDENKNLVCSLKRYSLRLKLQNQAVSCLGLGALFTPIKQRGKGYARRLMTQVLDEARDSGTKCALGFSDIDTTFYQSLGFLKLSAENIVISLEDLPSLTIKWQSRKAEPHDTPRLIAYFDRIFPADCVRSERDLPIWHFFRERNGPVEDYLLNDNGHEVGYVSLKPGPEALTLNEFFVPPSQEKNLLAFLKGLAEQKGLKELRGCKPFQALAHIPKKLEKRTKEMPIILFFEAESSLASINDNSWFGFLDQF